MTSIIHQHNAQILNHKPENIEAMCNCHQNNTCPMSGNCLKKCIIYKAYIESEGKSMIRYGLTENQFKFRYNNHTDSFQHKSKENQSELSKYIWKLKDSKKSYNIS